MKKFSSKFPDARILLVDDYVVNQEITKELLEMMECDVDVAEDGNEALDMYKDGNYDLIIMDVQMPEMDGYDAAREIRKIEGDEKHTIIVAVTANALEGDREKCLEAGMDDYMSKPFKGVDLEAMLNKHLDEKLKSE